MSIQDVINRMCTQTAVYWGNPRNDGQGGFTFDAAIEINCRWEDSNEVVVGNTGNTFSAKSVVYPTVDLVEEGMLFLGTLNDLDSTEIVSPMSLENAYLIKRFDKLLALGSTTEFLRKAYLTTKNMW